MRIFYLLFAGSIVASSNRQMTIEEIDAMINQDPKFWTNWDSVKKGTDDEFEAVMDEVDPVPGSPSSSTTHEVLSETDSTGPSQPTLLYTSLKRLYEMLAENPLMDANSIVEEIKSQTHAQNPYATLAQVEATRNVIFESCTIPLWAHKALIWMVQPNPDFALRFMDTFIRSFLSAFISAAPRQESNALLHMRYSIWIRYVLIPFVKEQAVNCEQIPGSDNLRLKPEHLPAVFRDQLDHFTKNPEKITELFGSVPRS